MRKTQTFQLVLTGLFAAIIIIMAFTPLGYIPLVVINATIIHIPVILGSLFCGPKKGGALGFLFGFTSFLNNTLKSASLSAFVFSPVLAYQMVGVTGIFKSIFICFVPRILVGVVPYFVYRLVKRVLVSEKKALWGTVLNLVIGLFLFVGIRAFIGKQTENTTLALVVAAVVAVLAAASLIVVSMKREGKFVAFAYAGVAGSMTNTLLVMGSIYVLYKEAYAQALSVSPDAVLGIIEGVISFNGVIEAIVAAILISAVGVVLAKAQPVYEKQLGEAGAKKAA